MFCAQIPHFPPQHLWLLYDEFYFTFHGHCQTVYGLDSAIENRPIGYLANVKYKVYPEIAIIYRGPTRYASAK